MTKIARKKSKETEEGKETSSKRAKKKHDENKQDIERRDEEIENVIEDENIETKHKKTEETKNRKDKKDHKESKFSQPEVNIGLVGHVDHGKTTLTLALTDKWTDTHSEELKRGITIRLGYADATIYKYEKADKYGTKQEYKGEKGEVIRTVSFVDAPGHETLMATMIAGSTIMDGALLLISATEKCPQPQTREHLMALQIAGIKNVIIVQNKVDLVSEEDALKNYEDIKEFLKNTEYKDVPVIPICALHKTNVDLLLEAIEKYIPTPKRDPDSNPLMYVARSFDINKPGSSPDKLMGGVLGGALKQGILRVGDEIEIKPGQRVMRANQLMCVPIKTKIVSAITGGHSVDAVYPGGSIGIMTELDPAIVASDALTGSIVGKPGALPETIYELKFKPSLLDRVVGAKDDLVVKPLAEKEVLMLNVNSAATVGTIMSLSKKIAVCRLKLPVCAEKGSKVTISRQLGNRWRLIGYGVIE